MRVLKDGGMRIQPVNAVAGEPGNRPMCLYLGEYGERCERAATEDGFCVRHGPRGRSWRGQTAATRKRAAILAAVGMLLPLIFEFLKNLFSRMR